MYRYLTNVLAPQTLTARQVCELYRRRWRIEDAFAVTKRLLDLAYVWTGEFIPIYGPRCLQGKKVPRWLVDCALACSPSRPRSWLSPG